jgi:predicted HTH domain antitoxin
MCEAIEEIRNDAVLETLIGLVKDGLLSLNVAAERANMTVEEFKEKTAELNN